ncbi:GntR family transcriptional regulator [Ferrithrix thermotolerans DSM 19514]|uniref:GntR family transcriptional regulator n=1 Tax=Ferrithrix thermotolerans DSM 19514 TaxID=1121881 RepID=A0A1M4WVU9_9ACTN|nr:GntR family transcriptional regulator [Ferrithrix thermotolerans]SHE85411.1 GntR family transcriptional regulator [Ferrithrix thermotolerans DSM 19514]
MAREKKWQIEGVLDPSDPMPLWAQLASALRDAILRGEFQSGFPSELELKGHFDVSRATVREAIRRLKEEGMLQSRQGSGTYVNGPNSYDRMQVSSSSIARAIRELGLEETSKVIGLEVVQDDRAARALNLSDGEKTLLVSRVRLGSQVPMALDYSWLKLPESLPLLDADLSQGALYESMVEECQILVSGGVDRYRASVATDLEAEYLSLEAGSPVIVAERIAYSGVTPIEYRRSTLATKRLALSAAWGFIPDKDKGESR